MLKNQGLRYYKEVPQFEAQTEVSKDSQCKFTVFAYYYLRYSRLKKTGNYTRQCFQKRNIKKLYLNIKKILWFKFWESLGTLIHLSNGFNIILNDFDIEIHRKMQYCIRLKKAIIINSNVSQIRGPAN